MEIDVAETVADQSQDGMALDALAEWRERYRSIQDGLAGRPPDPADLSDPPERRREL